MGIYVEVVDLNENIASCGPGCMQESNVEVDNIRRHWGETALFLLGATLLYGYHLLGLDLANLPPHEVALFTAWTLGVVWLLRSTVGWRQADSKPLPIADVQKYFSDYCERPVVRYSMATESIKRFLALRKYRSVRAFYQCGVF